MVPLLAALTAAAMAILVFVVLRAARRHDSTEEKVRPSRSRWSGDPVAAKAVTSAFDPAVLADVRGRLLAMALEAAQPHAAEEQVAHDEAAAGAGAVLARLDLSPRYTPRRPHLLPQLVQTVNDADSSAREIAGIIAQDPVLVGNLLRIANSPLYRLQARPVESIERAVTLLGTDGIRQIISAALVQPVMKLGGSAFPQFQSVVWEHSLLAGAAAADHARAIGREDGLPAQLLALLHGLAGVVVVQVLLDEYERRPGLVPSATVARALLQQWVPVTAERIAERWALPDPLRDALRAAVDGSGSSVSLARSLEFGQVAATLTLQCRRGELEESEALAILGARESQSHATQWIWRRLRASEQDAA